MSADLEWKAGLTLTWNTGFAFQKKNSALFFWKAGLVTFRLVQSPLYALLRAASIGFRWPGLYHDLGLQGAGKNEWRLEFDKFFYLLVGKLDCIRMIEITFGI